MSRLMFIAMLMLSLFATSPAEALNTGSQKSPKPVVSVIEDIKILDKWHGQQVICVALAIYHESRGLSDVSQFAVGSVVMNRSRGENYPPNPCGVVWDGYAFSWTMKKYKKKVPTELDAWEKAQRVAYVVYFDPDAFDPTLGATHFHGLKNAPEWASKGQNKTLIETHVFMRVIE